MIQSTPFAERIQQVFRPTPRGVVRLVDDLLGLCRVHQLRLRFTEGHGSIRRLGADDSDALTVPLPKSVFRAALARVAALCNEQHPGSVTPYRGEGEIVVPSPPSPNCSPPSTCYVSLLGREAQRQEAANAPSWPIWVGTRQFLKVRSRWRRPRRLNFCVPARPWLAITEFGAFVRGK